MSSTRRTTKYLALSATLSALSVVLLYIGAIVSVFDLTMVAIASMIVAFAQIELKGSYPVMIFGTTAFLSLLLLPDKFAALIYALLCGYYPILKPRLDRLPRLLRVIIKIVGFLLLLSAMLALAVFVFLLPEEEKKLLWLFYPLGLCAFLCYDLALDRLSFFYLLHLRKRLHIERFFRK